MKWRDGGNGKENSENHENHDRSRNPNIADLLSLRSILGPWLHHPTPRHHIQIPILHWKEGTRTLTPTGLLPLDLVYRHYDSQGTGHITRHPTVDRYFLVQSRWNGSIHSIIHALRLLLLTAIEV
jgi:hypothetical protein